MQKILFKTDNTHSYHCTKLKKENYLFSLCSPGLILTRSPQISRQNKSEASEPERLVKITYGIVASSLLKKSGKFKLGKIFELCRVTFSYTKMLTQKLICGLFFTSEMSEKYSNQFFQVKINV